jgi:iron complex transport system permease protein
MKSNVKLLILIIGLFVLLALNFAPFFGSLGENANADYILWQMRVPTVLITVLAGIILALTGLNYQYLFQNHLASPYTLGMASAAAFGSSFFLIAKKIAPGMPDQLQSLFSMGFALLTVFVLLRFLSKQAQSLYKVLLCGIAASLLFSSLIILIQYVLGNRDGFELMVSLLGQLAMVGYEVVIVSTILAAILIYFTAKNFHALRLLSVNFEYASGQSRDARKVFLQTVLVPSIVTAYLVSEIGPISFVGLIVPHIVRLFFRPERKQELIYNLLLGPVFLLACDLLAKKILPGQELPVGVTTSIVGGAFLISILF